MEHSATENDRNVASHGSEKSSDKQTRIRLRNLRHRFVKLQNKLITENKNIGAVRTNSDRNPCRSENTNAKLRSSNCGTSELNPSCLSEVGNDNYKGNIRVKPTITLPNVKTEAVTSIHFSFEDIPENEQWYQTFLRQDKGEEIDFSPANDFSHMKSLLWPYKIVPDHFDTFNKKLGYPQTTNVNTKKSSERKNNVRRSLRWHAPTITTLPRLWIQKKKTGGIKVSDDKLSRSGDENSISTSIANNANDSNQHREIDNLYQNVDLFLDVNSEIEVLYGSRVLPAVDASDEVNYSRSITLQVSKYERSHSADITEESIMDINMKYHELIDVDPAVLDEVAISEETFLGSVNDLCTPIRNRQGPTMDIISLINSYDSCSCAEGFMKI